MKLSADPVLAEVFGLIEVFAELEPHVGALVLQQIMQLPCMVLQHARVLAPPAILSWEILKMFKCSLSVMNNSISICDWALSQW